MQTYNSISATTEEYPSAEAARQNIVWKFREDTQQEMMPKSSFLNSFHA